MLTETMRRAGWRECPSDEVRRAWEAKGGRWQLWDRTCPPYIADRNEPRWTSGSWRPVNPQTWDYDPRGWGVVVGPESNQWGEWWWWQGEWIPMQAVKARRCDDGDFFLVVNGIDRYLSELGGRFIAPIPVPEVSNG